MDSLMLMTCGGVAAAMMLGWIHTNLRKTIADGMVFLPAIALAWSLLTRNESVDATWFMLGARFGLDETGQVFMGLTAVLWLATTIISRARFHRSQESDQYQFFYLLTMVGNLGLICSLDIASFLMFYTLMSVSVYGLIVHDKEKSSLRAGRIYIAMTIAGEMLLFAALAITAHEASSTLFSDLQTAIAVSENRGFITALVLAGFGIKLGIMPLHVWLPLAYPAAQTPVSAVLSGAMSKTGLLGIIRVLPLGIVGFELLGAAMIVAGLVTAFLGALIGVMQSNPKTVLAYSSCSQMGLVAVGIGVGLIEPAIWSTMLPALIYFAVHHGITKGALFTGYGFITATYQSDSLRKVLRAGLTLSALATAGTPLTTGYIAKNALKSGVELMESPWTPALSFLLLLTGVTTSLVMAHFILLVWNPALKRTESLSAARMLPWALLTLAVVTIKSTGTRFVLVEPKWTAFELPYLWSTLWPMGLAGIILWILLKYKTINTLLKKNTIPPGDLLNLLPDSTRYHAVSALGKEILTSARDRINAKVWTRRVVRLVERLPSHNQSAHSFELKIVVFISLSSILLLVLLVSHYANS